jgi:hypothetical protein
MREPFWNVWTEGYAATGEHGYAQFHGRVCAVTFEEACHRVWENAGGRKAMGEFTIGSDGRPRAWGCRFFDNEKDAKASYG